MPTDSEAQIRATIKDWSEALSAKNATRALSHYDGGAMQYSLAPPLEAGLPTAEDLESWFATWKGPVGREIQDLSVRVAGDLALVHGLVHMYGTKTDGEKPDLWFRLTLGLVRGGADWKIVHEHESVPFYMDGTYKAAVDLKP